MQRRVGWCETHPEVGGVNVAFACLEHEFRGGCVGAEWSGEVGELALGEVDPQLGLGGGGEGGGGGGGGGGCSEPREEGPEGCVR